MQDVFGEEMITAKSTTHWEIWSKTRADEKLHHKRSIKFRTLDDAREDLSGKPDFYKFEPVIVKVESTLTEEL